MAALELGSSSLRARSAFRIFILFIFRQRWNRGLSLRRGRGQNTDSGRSAWSCRSRRSVRRSRCGQAAAETLRTQELRDGGHPVVRQPDLGPLEPDGPEKKVRALICHWLHSWGLFHDRLNNSTLTLIRTIASRVPLRCSIQIQFVTLVAQFWWYYWDCGWFFKRTGLT